MEILWMKKRTWHQKWIPFIGFKRELDIVEERISELEDRSIEMINRWQRGKYGEKKQQPQSKPRTSRAMRQ